MVSSAVVVTVFFVYLVVYFDVLVVVCRYCRRSLLELENIRSEKYTLMLIVLHGNFRTYLSLST